MGEKCFGFRSNDYKPVICALKDQFIFIGNKKDSTWASHSHKKIVLQMKNTEIINEVKKNEIFLLFYRSGENGLKLQKYQYNKK